MYRCQKVQILKSPRNSKLDVSNAVDISNACVNALSACWDGDAHVVERHATKVPLTAIFVSAFLHT